MKVSGFPLLLATFGLAALQVTAGPVRVYIYSSEHSEQSKGAALANLRWGLAAANAVPAAPVPGFDATMIESHHKLEYEAGEIHHWKGKNAGMRKLKCNMRMKALSMANWLREKVGLPLIEAHPHHRLTRPIRPDPTSLPSDKGAHLVHILPITPIPGAQEASRDPQAVTHFRVHHSHHIRPVTFAGRLHKALMSLGPWEGRAVAFVLGCGIGSLLRMIYVLVVISYRSFQPEREDPVEYAEVDILFEEVEEVPPVYNDEKLASMEKEYIKA